MTIKALAFDLDGSLLDGQGTISPATGRALDILHDWGLHLIVASGRSYTSLPAGIHDFKGFEFAVTTNGAAIYHMPTDRPIARHLMAKEQVEAVLEATRDLPVGYEFYSNGQSYTERRYLEEPEYYGLSRRVMDYIKRTRQAIDDVHAFVAEHDLDGMSLSVDDLSLKSEIWEELQEAHADLNLTASVPRLIEITDAKASKGQGLKEVLDHLGFVPDELMAFGDGHNDKPMLEIAGHGVAMANAMPELFEVADDRCGHHTEDGIARYLTDYFQIPS